VLVEHGAGAGDEGVFDGFGRGFGAGNGVVAGREGREAATDALTIISAGP
jgi:hypothetical protein